MPLSKLTHERYAHAENLTDMEVDELYEYYKGLKMAFGGYVPREYLLVENNVHSNYERLKAMKELRKADKPKSTPTKMEHAARLYAKHRLDRSAFIQVWMNEYHQTLGNASTYWQQMQHGGPTVDQLIRTAIAELESQS